MTSEQLEAIRRLLRDLPAEDTDQAWELWRSLDSDSYRRYRENTDFCDDRGCFLGKMGFGHNCYPLCEHAVDLSNVVQGGQS